MCSSSSPPPSTSIRSAAGLFHLSRRPRVVGKDGLAGRVNYLLGKDPAKWHTGVLTYAKVAYRGVYPGVDLVYYGNQGQLEYDFVIAPKADPHMVRLAFLGAGLVPKSCIRSTAPFVAREGEDLAGEGAFDCA